MRNMRVRRNYRQNYERTNPTVDDWAWKHDLVMVVKERDHEPIDSPSRFYAKFERVEVVRGCIISSTFGNGHTPEEAIENYLEEIQGETLRINGIGPDSYDIVANFTLETEDGP